MSLLCAAGQGDSPGEWSVFGFRKRVEISAVVLKSEHLRGTYCMPGSVPRAFCTRTPCTSGQLQEMLSS